VSGCYWFCKENGLQYTLKKARSSGSFKMKFTVADPEGLVRSLEKAAS
jgi:hypothetical protein